MEGNRRSVMSVPPPPTSLSLSSVQWRESGSQAVLLFMYTHDDRDLYNLINRLHYVLFFFMVVCLNLFLSTYEQLFIIDNKLYSWNII